MATTDTLHAACIDCGEPGAKDGHDVICPNCGAVIDDAPIDRGPEWREFDGVRGREKRRTGPGKDTTRGDLGLGTRIGSHAELAADGGQLARANRYHNQVKRHTRKDERREYACNEISRIAAALDVGETLETQAHHLFREVHDADLAVGRDLDTLAATCLYLITRIFGRGITAADIEPTARTDARWIHRRATRLTRELDLEVPPPSLAARVRRAASEAGIETHHTQAALELADRVGDAPGVNGSPSAIAAAVLYEVCGGRDQSYTQTEIGAAAGVSATTLRNRWKDVKSVMDT